MSPAWAEETRQPLHIAFHVHTSVSDGAWTAQQVLQEAQRRGLDGVIFADSLVERWELGLPPLRHLVKRAYELPSVLSWGADHYLEHLTEISREFPSLVVLAGVTVSPLYHWTDIPILRQGVLEGWHRQLIILGLTDDTVLREMPVVSNRYASWTIMLRHPWRLWPLLLVGLGAWRWWRATRAGGHRWIGGMLAAMGCVLLLNADLTRTSPFSPYRRYLGPEPYQAVIDYTRAHGGYAIWAHPALTSRNSFHGIPVLTVPYPELLLQTREYLGFGVNYWSEISPIEPGREWDQALLLYCRGARAHAPWVLGEIGFHDPSRSLALVETVVYARDKTPQAVLAALRDGHAYAQCNVETGPDLELSMVRLVNEATQQAAGLGETLHGAGPWRLELSGHQRDGSTPTILTIIRNGVVVHRVTLEASPFAIVWRDDAPLDGARSYYRVMMQRNTSAVFTNPIFVQPL